MDVIGMMMITCTCAHSADDDAAPMLSFILRYPRRPGRQPRPYPRRHTVYSLGAEKFLRRPLLACYISNSAQATPYDSRLSISSLFMHGSRHLYASTFACAVTAFPRQAPHCHAQMLDAISPLDARLSAIHNTSALAAAASAYVTRIRPRLACARRRKIVEFTIFLPWSSVHLAGPPRP